MTLRFVADEHFNGKIVDRDQPTGAVRQLLSCTCWRRLARRKSWRGRFCSCLSRAVVLHLLEALRLLIDEKIDGHALRVWSHGRATVGPVLAEMPLQIGDEQLAS